MLERNKIQEREGISSEIVRLDERKIAMRKEYDELNSSTASLAASTSLSRETIESLISSVLWRRFSLFLS